MNKKILYFNCFKITLFVIIIIIIIIVSTLRKMIELQGLSVPDIVKIRQALSKLKKIKRRADSSYCVHGSFS